MSRIQTAASSNSRLASVQAAMEDSGLGTLVLVEPTNIEYVTGYRVKPFERLIALVIPAADAPRLVAPSLEEEAARSVLPSEAELHVWQDEDGPGEALAEALSGVVGSVGVEKKRLVVDYFELLQSVVVGASFSSCDELLRNLRVCKDSDEIEHFRNAARIVDAAMEQVAQEAIHVGRSETDVASDCVRYLKEAGGAESPFEPIVLAGARSAFPHAHPSGDTIAAGDLVIVDFGIPSGGYWADITRTFVAGREPDERQHELYKVVRTAQEAGIKAARPGNRCCDVDRAARSVIEEAGLGSYFVHRTGHGLGLEVHEPPYLTSQNDEILEEGMVVTVEPGVYVPGYGGVRIEDDIVIQATAPEVLTKVPKSLDQREKV